MSSSFFFINRIVDLLSEYNFVIVDGRPYCNYIFDFLKVSDKVIYKDSALFNAMPIGVGYAMKNRNLYVWINLSDSQVTHGTFYQSLVLVKKFSINNVLITIDFNGLRLRDGVDIHYDDLQRIINVFLETQIVNKPENLEKLTFPSCLILRTKKGFGCSLFEENPLEYHYRRMDEKLYLQCVKHLSI